MKTDTRTKMRDPFRKEFSNRKGFIRSDCMIFDLIKLYQVMLAGELFARKKPLNNEGTIAN